MSRFLLGEMQWFLRFLNPSYVMPANQCSSLQRVLSKLALVTGILGYGRLLPRALYVSDSPLFALRLFTIAVSLEQELWKHVR